MIAAVLKQANQPLEIAEVEPCELQYGQVLVNVLVSGICGAQLSEIRGEKGTHFPRLMGHEGCGIVSEVGPGVTKMKVGDKVVMHWRKSEGMDSDFPRYRYNGSEITSGLVTTFSEYSICSANRLTVVPHDTPNELCSLLGCALSTALGVIENEAKLKSGESILVIGCGGVGANVIRVAKMYGPSRLCAMDANAAKSKMAIALGADGFVSSPSDIHNHYDVIVDTAGDASAFAEILPKLAPSGRYIMVGQPKPETSLVITSARHLFDGEGKTIKATQGGGFNPDTDIPRYVKLWKSGFLKIGGIITHRFPLKEVNTALGMLRDGQAGRVMLDCV